MIGKALAEVTFRDLEDLCDNCVQESRTIEYKLELTLGGREERKEFLADLTAFANTAGGDLIFGVAEEQGEPTGLPGIDISNWDELQRTLSSLIRDGTEPRGRSKRGRRELARLVERLGRAAPEASER